MTFDKALLGLLLVAAMPLATTASAAPKLHAPNTQAERALDKTLRTAGADARILDNLFNRTPTFPVPPKQRVDYSRLLTAKLLAALKAQEKKLVDADCGGKYIAGDICGMDYNPITCAQDSASRFTYATTQSSGTGAVILDSNGNRYSMVSAKNVWSLDAVACKP